MHVCVCVFANQGCVVSEHAIAIKVAQILQRARDTGYTLTTRFTFDLFLAKPPQAWINYHLNIKLTYCQQPDSTASCCASPTCTTFFTFLARRHHCRRCGDIFCQPHSTHMIPLDQEARFHPSGSPQRSCDTCWADYQTWNYARKSRTSSIASGDTATAHSGAINVVGGHDSAIGMGSNKDTKVGSIAVSVPRDWNWSTF